MWLGTLTYIIKSELGYIASYRFGVAYWSEYQNDAKRFSDADEFRESRFMLRAAFPNSNVRGVRLMPVPQ